VAASVSGGSSAFAGSSGGATDSFSLSGDGARADWGGSGGAVSSLEAAGAIAWRSAAANSPGFGADSAGLAKGAAPIFGIAKAGARGAANIDGFAAGGSIAIGTG
jgi:hypothetical protein